MPSAASNMVEGVSGPRVVMVTRPTPLELLVERHGTVGQVRFYLGERGLQMESVEAAHRAQHEATHAVEVAIPRECRRARVDRSELDRFLFAEDDIIIVVGQDGLVPNVAKYLAGQPVIGVNPDPAQYDGVLCRVSPSLVEQAIRWTIAPRDGFGLEPRVLARVQREDGQSTVALNEVFIGHRTHQSARYRIVVQDRTERHSSSGIIFATGTGCTGWARSIAQQRGLTDRLPRPTDSSLAWFVREPFPSVSTGTELDFGLLDDRSVVRVISEMGEGGVIFADGIERDAIEFSAGQSAELSLAPHRLRLVVPA